LLQAAPVHAVEAAFVVPGGAVPPGAVPMVEGNGFATSHAGEAQSLPEEHVAMVQSVKSPDVNPPF